MPKTRPPYPEEFRREAVGLIRSGQRSVAEASASLGVSQQTLRNWLKQTDVDAGRVEGVSSEEREELRRLRRGNRVLREEREILKSVSGRWRGRLCGGRIPALVVARIDADAAWCDRARKKVWRGGLWDR
jgi:transposase